ncbi:hypothetical protein BH11ACT4_BH11ACT4_13100 [soil metagenome]
MTRFLAVLMIVVCAAVVGWLNHERIAVFLDDGTSSAPTATPGPAQLGASPDPRYRFALIDPTTSTDTSFRTAMKADLISAVTGYVPDKPSDPPSGVPEVIGLELTVKLVGTDSLAYGQQTVQVSIPSVAALPARPDLTADGALDPGGPYDVWQDSAETWSDDYDAAVDAAASGLAALDSIDLDRDEWSGITAGAAALALLAPVDGDVAFAVFSDLDENRTTQPAQFNGHPILVVQPDNVGDIGRWQALFERFSTWGTANGAGSITRVRPEAAASAINTFITES